MLVEGIGKVTLANDILRVEVMISDHDGTLKSNGDLLIPKGSVEGIINGLVSSVNDINTKIGETIKNNKDSKESGNGKKETESKKK
tara:strand:- start:444 stop:701 length:258 start_codon:yes stop_codon:yes gene_type:complete